MGGNTTSTDGSRETFPPLSACMLSLALAAGRNTRLVRIPAKQVVRVPVSGMGCRLDGRSR